MNVFLYVLFRLLTSWKLPFSSFFSVRSSLMSFQVSTIQDRRHIASCWVLYHWIIDIQYVGFLQLYAERILTLSWWYQQGNCQSMSDIIWFLLPHHLNSEKALFCNFIAYLVALSLFGEIQHIAKLYSACWRLKSIPDFTTF